MLTLMAFQNRTIISVTPQGSKGFKEPQIAVENDGHVYVAYGSGDATYVSVSKDSGINFSNPILVSQSGKLALGMRRGPRISAHNGTVTISAIYGQTGKGQDGDLVAFRSTDHGATWSKASRVSDVDGSAREGLHAMAVAADGTLACTWLDLRSKGTKLFMSTSRDGGLSWEKNLLVYESPSGTICECCHPSLVFDKTSKLIVMFRNTLDGARDMYLTSTVDRGKTFSPATKLGKGTWMLDACPMDGGMLSVAPEGQIQTIWRRENQVYVSTLGRDETALASGKQPWIATGLNGEVAVVASPQGIVMIPAGSIPTTLSPAGVDPVVASSPNHKIIVAAWADYGIQLARL